VAIAIHCNFRPPDRSREFQTFRTKEFRILGISNPDPNSDSNLKPNPNSNTNT